MSEGFALAEMIWDEQGNPVTGATDPGRRGEAVPGVLLRLEAADEERWLTCSYAPLSDGGYVVVARDDTARKKLQDDKDGWIAQVSHELRTPLTPIKGFLHTLARRDAELTHEDRSRIYEIMIREEQRLEALVDSLLRSTQLEAGGLVVATAEVAWADRVAEQVALAAQQDPGREVVLTGVGDGAGTVLADDPSLTARGDGGELLAHQPIPVVFGTTPVPADAALRRHRRRRPVRG